MANIERLILRLDAEVDKYNQNMARAAKATDRSTQKMSKDIRSTESQIKKFSSNSIRSLQIFGAAIGVALSTRELVRYADTWNRVQNRLLLATESGKEAAETLDDLAQVAIRSRTDLDASALLFQRIERGTRDLKLETEELLEVTETINKAFVINGATAQEASASVIQLSQAFSRGVLRGDEFRSVSEQAPEILRAIAAATGKTRGELIKYAEQGKLTTDIIIKSLQAHGAVVEEEFGRTQFTISQTVSVVETEFARFIGTLDDTNKVTEQFTGLVLDATKNMDDWVGPINNTTDALIIWIKEWERAFGTDAIVGISLFGKTFSREIMALNSIVKVTVDFITDAFVNMPNNIVAATKILVVEIASFTDRIMEPVQGFVDKSRELIKHYLADVDAFFGRITEEQRNSMQAQFTEELLAQQATLKEGAEAAIVARESAIAKILEEREENKTSFDLRMSQIEAERAQLALSAEAALELKRVREEPEPFINLDEETQEDKQKQLDKDVKAEQDRLKKEDSALKKSEGIKKRLRSQGRKDAMTIMMALAGDNEKAARAVFIVDKALAAAEVFVNTEVAASRALAELGPIIGPPVAGAIIAGGALSIAAILATAISGGGGSSGAYSGGAGGSPDSSPEINTEPFAQGGVIASEQGDDSSGVQVIQFTANAGDELGEVMTHWMNENIKKGRIVTG